MAEEIEKNELDENQEDVENQEDIDNQKDTKTEEEQEAESKKSVVDKIRDTIAGFRKKPDDTDDLDEEAADVPDKFTEAALKDGWTEDEVVKFASDYDDDKDLIEMIPYLFEEESEEEEEEEDKDKKKSDDVDDKDDDKTDREKLKKEIRDELLKEIGPLKENLEKAKKDKDREFLVNLRKQADEIFDKVSEEFEVFGKTEDLPKFPAGRKKGQLIPTTPAFKARNEVFTSAFMFLKEGLSPKEAIENALLLYKGKHLEKDVKRNLIKDLKKNQTRLSAKRTAKDDIREFESESEEKVAVVEDIIKKVTGKQSH